MKGIVFEDPGFLYLLSIVPIMAVLYFWKFSGKTAHLKVPTLKPFENRGTNWKSLLRPSIFIVQLIVVSLLIVILARPQTTRRWIDEKTEGIDIILALDISGSMLARDFVPDRLEAAKNVATEFISGRPYDRIGLVVFSGESFTQCPLTTDHISVVNLLRELKSGMIEDGTAIGMGLATAISRIKDSEAKSKVVILLTDGVNNRGEIAPVTAAELAKTFDVKVYTIGIGTMGTAPFPVQTPFGIQYRNMPVEIDEAMLQEISTLTGGQYFRATDNEALKRVYDEIDKLEKTEIDVKQLSKREEAYMRLSFVALILMLISILAEKILIKKIT